MKNIYKFICFDTETTGIDSDAEILSLAIVDQDNNVLFNERFKPIAHTSWDAAQAVHGISPEDVKECLSIYKYRKEIEEIFSQYELIVGYNIDYDFRMLEHDLLIDFRDNKIIHDVMHLFAPIYGEKGYYGRYKWKKLEVCANYYNYEFNAHDALEDVKATIYCYKKIKGLI